MNSASSDPQHTLSNQTISALLKAYGLNDTQTQTALTDLRTILEYELLGKIGKALNEHQLKVLDSLKTERSITQFVHQQIPEFDQLIVETTQQIKNETQDKLESFKQESFLDVGKAATSHSTSTVSRQESSQTEIKPGEATQPQAEKHLAAPTPQPAPAVQKTAPPISPPADKTAPAHPAADAPTLPATEIKAEGNTGEKQTVESKPESDKKDSKLGDFRKKWAKLLQPPPPKPKPDKPKDDGAAKKGKLPPLPPLPPMPGMGGKKGPSPEELKAEEEARDKERSEARAKQEAQRQKDAAVIAQIEAEIAAMPESRPPDEDPEEAEIDWAAIEAKRKALKQQIKQLSDQGNWFQAYEAIKLLKQLRS